MKTKQLIKGYRHTSSSGLLLEDVGAGISSYRKREGLTQEALGGLMGLDKSQISKLEKGGNPTVATIRKAFSSMGADIHLIVTPSSKTAPESYLDDLIATIDAFAKSHGLTSRQAFNYLDRFGGINFYLEDPELEQELPIKDTIAALEKVCRNNGGHAKKKTEETMTKDQTYIIAALTRELILRLMDEFSWSLPEALRTVYNSETYSRLADISTGEYEYGSTGVYSDLRAEVLTGVPPKEY